MKIRKGLKICVILMLSLMFIACNEQVKIISSEKKIIIPGRKGVEPFINYEIDVELASDYSISDIKLTLKINDKEEFLENTIIDKSTAKIIASISKQGRYQLKGKSRNQEVAKEGTKEVLIISYKHNDTTYKHELSDFTTSTKRLR